MMWGGFDASYLRRRDSKLLCRSKLNETTQRTAKSHFGEILVLVLLSAGAGLRAKRSDEPSSVILKPDLTLDQHTLIFSSRAHLLYLVSLSLFKTTHLPCLTNVPDSPPTSQFVLFNCPPTTESDGLHTNRWCQSLGLRPGCEGPRLSS